MVSFAPSILSADFSNLKEEIKKVSDAKYIHLDVMDGHFVPNITFGPQLIKSIRPYSDQIFDTHLMIDNPEKYIEEFAKAGSDIITVHIEVTNHIHRLIEQIKDQDCMAGVTLNPGTPLTTLKYILDDIDLILIMSVNPGFGGQSYISQMTEKIVKLNEMINKSDNDILVEVDGGINFENVKKITEAGVDIVVSGSTIFKGNPRQNLKKLKKIVRG